MAEQLFIAFRVLGEAQPAGSKTAYPVINKKTGQPVRDANGRIMINMADACKKSPGWKKLVGEIARIEMKAKGIHQPAAGPLRLVARFYKVRPGTHFRSGRFSEIMKDDAPPFPTGSPDVLKLARAVEDGMNEIVYLDDSQIVRETITKEYGRVACVDLEIYRVL